MDTAKNISILHRKLNAATTSRLSHLGLSSSKAQLLFCISDHHIMTQSELCRELDLDKSTVAKMLLRLEKDKFVIRKTNPDDTRSVLVALTEKGASVITEARTVIDQWIAEATSCLSRQDQETFSLLLEKISSHIGEE